MKDDSAIRQAIHIFKYPANLRHRDESRVRTGMLDLLKAAAGHEETVERLSETENVTKEIVCEASKHYLRGLITDSKNNPYTTLSAIVCATGTESLNEGRCASRSVNKAKSGYSVRQGKS